MPEELAKILIVDDDEDITVTISDYFTSQDLGIIPITTSDPRRVLSLLDEHEDISLILSDFRMPGINGFELLMMVKERRPHILFVLMTGYSTQELRREGLKRGAIRYIEKPFDLEELAGTIREALQGAAAGFGGHIESIQLPDIIQLVGMSRRSMTLNITADQGRAAIYFQDGEVIHAVCGDLAGEEAFYDVFKWTGGQFTFSTKGDSSRRTIDQSWQGLLIEAARREDEAQAEAAGELEKGGEFEPAFELGEGVVKVEAPAEQPAEAAEGDQVVPAEEKVVPAEPLAEEVVPGGEPAPPPGKPEGVERPRVGVSLETWKLKDRQLQGAVEMAVKRFLSLWEGDAKVASFRNLKLKSLPECVQRHFYWRFHQVLRRFFNTDGAPFDFDQEDVSRALEGLFQALLGNWLLSREFYREAVEEAVIFEVERGLDPVRALVDLVQEQTDGDAAAIRAILETLLEHSLIEEHFRSLLEDLKRRHDRRIHTRQLEYLGRAILYRRDEEEGFRLMRQAMANILGIAAAGAAEPGERLSVETVAGMLESHGLVQVADFLRVERGAEQGAFAIDDLDRLWERYRSNAGS